MLKKFMFIYQEKEYEGVVYFRHHATQLSFRVVDNRLRVSAPLYISITEIKKQLLRLPPKFLQKLDSIPMLKKDYIYILGEKRPLRHISQVCDDPHVVTYKNEEDLLRKLKSLAIEVLTRQTRKYEEIMGIKPQYNVRVKKMTTRHASNSSQTHSIIYNLKLIEQPISVIDAIVVHELAHYFHRNHAEAFYEVVYKYYPQYKKEHAKLKETHQ